MKILGFIVLFILSSVTIFIVSYLIGYKRGLKDQITDELDEEAFHHEPKSEITEWYDKELLEGAKKFSVIKQPGEYGKTIEFQKYSELKKEKSDEQR